VVLRADLDVFGDENISDWESTSGPSNCSMVAIPTRRQRLFNTRLM
jgi:hypothetical protein